MLRWILSASAAGAVLLTLSAAPALAHPATEQTMKTEQTMAAARSAHGAHAVRTTASAQTAMVVLERGVLSQLNRVRADHGLVPLTLDVQLSAAAAQHTSEMVSDGYFAHESHDGSAFWKRLTAYTRGAKHSWGVGENLLWSAGDVDPAEALRLWMNSPEHRANILSAEWRQIGIAAVYATSAPGTFGDNAVTVITTDFGVRS